MDSNHNKNSYYGVIEEIWELEYGPLNIPLFLCQWVKLTGGGIRKDQYGMTIVDLTKIGFKYEPFVLAKNVHQVFYVKVSVQKVVPTLTSTGAEIYLSMANAKQLSDTSFILVPVGAVCLVEVCSRHCIALHCGACRELQERREGR
jgi:hypothetical protein